MRTGRWLSVTTNLAPLLGERGVELFATPAYRLTVQRPERLSTLSSRPATALNCTPTSLSRRTFVTGCTTGRNNFRAGDAAPPDPSSRPDRPRSARCRRPIPGPPDETERRAVAAEVPGPQPAAAASLHTSSRSRGCPQLSGKGGRSPSPATTASITRQRPRYLGSSVCDASPFRPVDRGVQIYQRHRHRSKQEPQAVPVGAVQPHSAWRRTTGLPPAFGDRGSGPCPATDMGPGRPGPTDVARAADRLHDQPPRSTNPMARDGLHLWTVMMRSA